MARKERTSPFSTMSQLGLGILTAVILLSLLEIGLRVAGYHGPSTLEDPYLGFENVYPLFGVSERSDGSAIYATNPNKLKFFNNQTFALPKPSRTFRIFCFGGSTTYGRPFKSQTAFPHWLEILLNSMDPTRHYEVINAGGISYASYRIIPLIEETLQYEPDLFIVYTGHNEFLERRTYREIFERSSAIRALTRSLNHLRLYDLLRQWISAMQDEIVAGERQILPAEVETVLEHSAGFDFYSRKTIQKEETFSHFRENLFRMDEIASEGGVPIVFINLVSNLLDFSPFKSEHREDIPPDALLTWERYYRQGLNLMKSGSIEEALHSFTEASRIDSIYADLIYQRGRSALHLGKVDIADRYLRQARDEDVCPLRAPGRINEIIDEVSQESGTPLVDIIDPFVVRNRELVGHPVLGNALFLDHLHPTIEGHQIIANQVAQELIRLELIHLSPDWDPETVSRRFDEILVSLDDDYFAEGNLNLGKVLLWARKTKEALIPLRIAAERIPDNADAQYTLGTCFASLGRSDAAIEAFRKTLSLDPENQRARNNLGLELKKKGDYESALEEFREILLYDPNNTKVINNIGLIFYSKGDLDQAEATFRSILKKTGENPEAYNNLGIVQVARDDLPSAEKNFRKAIALRLNYREALNNLSMVLLRQGKTAEALAISKEALKAFPDSPEFHNNLGEILRGIGRHDEARQEFIVALSLRPGWKRALDNLASLQPL